MLNDITHEQLSKLTYNLSIKYLGRYSSSSGNLQNFLLKKLKKIYLLSLQETPSLLYTFQTICEQTVQKMVDLNYINDEQFVKSKGKAILNKGKSTFSMIQKLQEKGVKKEKVAQVLQHINHTELDLYAIVKLIKKKHMGCYAKQNETFVEEFEEPDLEKTADQLNLLKQTQKNIASLYRNGFSYDIIKKALCLSKFEAEEILLKNINFNDE